MTQGSKFVYQALNRRFRGEAPVLECMFPAHEFDAVEANELAKFATRICTEGYEFINAEEHGKILDLAAEYGVFVSYAIGSWYLGVFIAAELVMEPFAEESFARPMVRSEVFGASTREVQEAALFLMLLSILADRISTSTRRLEEFENALQEKLKRSLSSIDTATALAWLGKSVLEDSSVIP